MSSVAPRMAFTSARVRAFRLRRRGVSDIDRIARKAIVRYRNAGREEVLLAVYRRLGVPNDLLGAVVASRESDAVCLPDATSSGKSAATFLRYWCTTEV